MPISPQIWNKAALNDNRFLPARYSIGVFTGKGVNIANNEEAYAYDDILVSDRIFDYDDRRLNGLNNYAANTGFNADGRDGWGASAYGPFQTVRFTRRVFTSGQHKSIAWRVFDEKQYAGDIGNFGTATKSGAYTGGEAYMSTAETINKAKKIWDAEILGPHIDKYNFFAIANGHIAGRFVQTYANQGRMFDCEGQWIASPGPYAGLSFQPEFAPIKAVEWDSLNVRPLLNAIDVAWTNLFIPEDNRVILLDKAYKDDLLSNLIGIPGSAPATDKAYDDLREGRFERFYGWDFDFSIPSQYYPKVYLDANNNVVHDALGTGAYDAMLNSIQAPDGVLKLQTELAAAGRVRATNYIGTYYDADNATFVNEITNYALSMPSGAPYYGDAEEWTENLRDWEVTSINDFPWQGYPGQGIKTPTGPQGAITRRQVIGMAVYRPAAQLGEEYGYMETDRGKTRGKFTELVFDMKHDAWVIPNLSHGILLIVDGEENVGQPALKVEIVDNTPYEAPEIVSLEVTPATLSITASQQAIMNVQVTATGTDPDLGWNAISSDTSIVTVDSAGIITGVGKGDATITVTSTMDPTKTDTVAVTVTARP
ncbi:MAG: Ig-like domain-containing protein [Bacteroidales bacterium]|nr:Ig-like domain-containing protein [Candidatus Colimorpha merdihippi]